MDERGAIRHPERATRNSLTRNPTKASELSTPSVGRPTRKPRRLAGPVDHAAYLP